MEDRVSVFCPAPRHNTIKAATRGPKRDRCICPPALTLAEAERVRSVMNTRRRREKDGKAYRGLNIMPVLPGNGPWRILPHCRSAVHNTRDAAMYGPPDNRCICPRALDCVATHRRSQAEVERRRREAKKVGRMKQSGAVGGLPSYLTNTLAAMPSMPRAACSTPIGIKVADGAYEGRSGFESAAKRLCGSCPERLTCRAAVLKGERYPGEWGGVYGGLNVADRRKIRNSATPREAGVA